MIKIDHIASQNEIHVLLKSSSEIQSLQKEFRVGKIKNCSKSKRIFLKEQSLKERCLI